MNKTSYKTRFSYAASDVAGQLVFTFIVGGYLSKFFTDIYGLSAIICGTIIALARWIDAIAARRGGFPELVNEREYKIIFISPRGRQVKTIRYQGRATRVSLDGGCVGDPPQRVTGSAPLE